MAGAADCAIGAPSKPVRKRRLWTSGLCVADFIVSVRSVSARAGVMPYPDQRNDSAPAIQLNCLATWMCEAGGADSAFALLFPPQPALKRRCNRAEPQHRRREVERG